MSRRPALLLALIASFAVVACQATPAAPPLTDPKEIMVKSVESLQNVKTMQLKGTFTGSVSAQQMGNFDLSSVKLDLGLDVEGKKARMTLDAPSLLGTNLDLIALTDSVYLKMTGPLAGMAGVDTTGKYTKMPIDAGAVPEEATDPSKAIAELRTQLDQLPKAPEKLPDEQCAGTDCYHIRISMSGAELSQLAPGAESQVGSVAFDMWTRKNDLRPGRFAFTVDAGAQGNMTGTFDVTYDQSLDIAAPPADQVAPASQ